MLLRTEGLCSVCLRGYSGSLAFILEDILGNVDAVKSLFLVPKVSFRVHSQYPDGLSASPEAFKADQKTLF